MVMIEDLIETVAVEIAEVPQYCLVFRDSVCGDRHGRIRSARVALGKS
jgi:hypothetical protein